MAAPVKIVLVPVDGSESANAAARYSAELAEKLQVPVRLLYAFPERPLDLVNVSYEGATSQTVRALEMSMQNFEKLLAETSARAFELAREAMGERTLQIEQQVVRGDTGQAIVAHAKSEPGALVIIGRRRRSRLGEVLMLGSVSRFVVHHAPCPVLVVR
jgi:nucleotide-binding universal stress UspA family protein